MTIGVTAMTVIMLVGACWTDLRRMRIPNGWTVGFAAGGLAYHTIVSGGIGAGQSLAGAAAGLIPLLVLYRLGGIGGGDVKWFGAFGSWVGAIAALQLLIYSILFAGGISALLLLLRMPGVRKWGRRLPWPWGAHPVGSGKTASFPFMLAVTPAFACLLWSMQGGWF
jgi:prepilin peptidase CpaA